MMQSGPKIRRIPSVRVAQNYRQNEFLTSSAPKRWGYRPIAGKIPRRIKVFTDKSFGDLDPIVPPEIFPCFKRLFGAKCHGMKDLWPKTIRYPGHFEVVLTAPGKVRCLRHLSGGTKLSH